MFEGKSVWDVLEMGGFTLYVLILCSVVSLGILLERCITYHLQSVDRKDFMRRLRTFFETSDMAAAIGYCQSIKAPVASVVLSALTHSHLDRTFITKATEREIMSETEKLERYTTIVGTIGNIAVYIGLFGTVLGIVRSFHNMSQIGSGGISIVIGGVAEALICTAAGLSVSIPAVTAYNYFNRKVDGFIVDMEYCSSEITDILFMEENK